MKQISRDNKGDTRKQQILNAAFSEFTKNGFALTKMDDIAKKAGVSKGLIYHHFQSKEDLLNELVQTHIVVLFPKSAPSFKHEDKVKDFLFTMFSNLIKEATTGDAWKLFFLILTEGERFPKISEMYYKTVLVPVMGYLKKILKIAWQKGELKSKAVIDMPQLLVGPLMISLLWSKLFDHYKKLDFDALLKTNLDNIFYG